jgi:hypothetical protein
MWNGPIPTAICTHTASDPRLTGTLGIDFRGEFQPPVVTTGMDWFEATLDGPDGTWSGDWYRTGDSEDVARVVSVLAGDGASEGWMYVASSTDPAGPDSRGIGQDFFGLVYRGQGLPPELGPLPSPASE